MPFPKLILTILLIAGLGFPSHTLWAAQTKKKKEKTYVAPVYAVFQTQDTKGKVINCGPIKGALVAVKKKSEKNGKATIAFLYKKQIADLKNKVKHASSFLRKKLKKSLKKLTTQQKTHDQLCSAGPFPDGPPPATVLLNPYYGSLSPADVRYLYEKVALGAVTPEAISIGTTQGVDALVEYLFTLRPEGAVEADAAKYLDENYVQDSDIVTARGIQQWALQLLLNTPNPFYDRNALLFLHNYFATSVEVVAATSEERHLMVDHLNLIRGHSITGDFRTLLKSITRDPVMLLWLNGNQNTSSAPNENFARELLELFTVSPTDPNGFPNYSETTIEQIAKACTGWTVVLENNYYISKFLDKRFATGQKLLFEDRPLPLYGSVNNDFDTIDRILDFHPEAPKYIARRILNEYLTESPPQDLVDALALDVKANNYFLNPVLKKLFKSTIFWSTIYRDSIVKDPVESAVEALRALKVPFNNNQLFVVIQQSLEVAGKVISQPPSVFGWDHEDFLTGQDRLNYSKVFTNVVKNGALNGAYYNSLLPAPKATDQQVLTHFEELFGVSLTSEQRSSLIAYMNNNLTGSGKVVSSPWDAANASKVRKKLAGLIEIFTRLNPYQLR